jgi:hypothetical protein
MTKMRIGLKNLVIWCVSVMMLCGAASAEKVGGVVINKTNNKPVAGDDVVLLQLAQGMQELARTKTDSRGHYSIEVPAEGIHLLRVTHDKANYFKPVQPGDSTVDIDVYTAAPQVDGVTLEADVMRIETDPSGNSLNVVEHFFVKNVSSPQETLMSDHPFELYLPPGATVAGIAAKGPGGMAVQQSLVPENEPNKFTIIFPLRPGETEFQVSYKLPYSPDKGLQFSPRPTMATDTLALMLPKSMTFKPGQSTHYTPVNDPSLGAQTYVARNAQPSEPLAFTLTGSGQLPRDTGTQDAASQGPAGASTAGTQDPNADTRPGGGLGVPVDKDADREGWISKYKIWIIVGLGFVFAAAAGFMLKAPSGSTSGSVPAGPAGALQVLRDEMFALETDRLGGKVTAGEYQELKAAYDLVLKRTLDRSGALAAETEPEINAEV